MTELVTRGVSIDDAISRSGATVVHLIVQGARAKDRDLSYEQPNADIYMSEDISCLKVLLEHKVNIRAKDKDGSQVLHFLANSSWPPEELGRSEQLIPLLVHHGADVNAIDSSGDCPLFLAAIHLKPQMVQTLQKVGAHSLSAVDQQRLLASRAGSGKLPKSSIS